MSLNKSLLVVLVILMVVAVGASVVSAYSDEGSGSIEGNSSGGGSDYISDDSVDPDIEYDSDDEGFSVSLSEHATANPVILLLAALAFVGVSTRIR